MGNRYKPYVLTPKEREDKAFDMFADMLIEKLENTKKSEWKKPWFSEAEMAWPKALYGKAYHGMNALMLSLLCEKRNYKIPVFATNDRIFSLNFQKDENGTRIPAVNEEGEKLPFVHILKGEKSFPVFLSCVSITNKETKEKIKWADYVKLSDAEKEDYWVKHKRIVHNVFNVDQTNIKEARPELYAKLEKENLPQKVEIIPGEDFNFEPIDIMVEKQLWVCPFEIKHLGAGDSPFYSPSKDYIQLGEKSQYREGGHPESWTNDCFHEMMHSTGHPSRLKRDKGSYAREELVAEVGAALCCHRYGIPKVLKEDSIPYVQSWLDSLHEEPQFIRSVLKDVKLGTSLVDSKIEEVRRIYIDKEDKIDVREDEDTLIDIDEDGDISVTEEENLNPDKKQGESEDQEVSIPEEKHRSMRI